MYSTIYDEIENINKFYWKKRGEGYISSCLVAIHLEIQSNVSKL